MFDAHLEKKLQEKHDAVTFIRHSNLTDQGQIIKDIYREDQLYLSSRGVKVLQGNLLRTILVSFNVITQEKLYLKSILILTTHKEDSMRIDTWMLTDDLIIQVTWTLVFNIIIQDTLIITEDKKTHLLGTWIITDNWMIKGT